MALLSMFKKSRDITAAPRIGRIPLPDVEGADNMIEKVVMEDIPDCAAQPLIHAPTPRKPMTSLPRCATPTSPLSSRAVTPHPDSVTSRWRSLTEPVRRASTPQPDILKPPKPCRSSTPQSSLSSSSRLTERSLSPQSEPVKKKPLKGILKPARKPSPTPTQVSLHWQLIPYDRSMCRDPVYFDVTQETRFIRYGSSILCPSLKPSDFDKPAGNIPVLRMEIHCAELPHWNIQVENPEGITCKDVFDAIYDTLHVPLTSEEKKLHVPRDRRDLCKRAFERRCREAPRLSEVVKKEGMKRVDLLEDKRIFSGLRLSWNGEDPFWILNISAPSRDR